MNKQFRFYLICGLCVVTLLCWLVWQSVAQPVVFSPGGVNTGSGVAGVSSFNLRSGPVSLTKGDVTALGALDNDTTGNAAAANASQNPTFRIPAPTGVAAALEFYSNGGADDWFLLINNYSNLLTGLSIVARNFTITQEAPGYSANVTLDFQGSGNLWIPLEGDITFTSANLWAGRGVTVRLDAGEADRTINCPAWHFLAGGQTITLAANKIGILTVLAYDGSEANCVATWASE